MITLLRAALRARRGIAAIIFLLAASAAAAAAAGPAYQSAAIEAVRANEVASAPVDELMLESTRLGTLEDIRKEPPLPYIEGAQTLYARILPGLVWGPERADDQPLRTDLVYRTAFCEHLSIQAGRCAVAPMELDLREDMARRLNVKPGDEVSLQIFERDLEQRFTVVGIYGHPDITDPYWASRPEIAVSSTGTGAVFTSDATFESLPGSLAEWVDILAGPQAFADTALLRSELEDADTRLAAARFSTLAHIQATADRIDESEKLLGGMLTAAILPLVLLCWFLLFLAVTGAVDQRRDELGLIALRGVPARYRWLLPSLETAVPVLLGAAAGLPLGYFATSLFAAVVLPGDVVVGGLGNSAQAAAIAVAGALLAGLAAQARALAAPVLSLLRRVSRKRRTVALAAVETAGGVLAAVAGYQATTAGASGGGVGLVAPLCIAIGLGLVAARVVVGPAERVGRRALRRGRITLGAASLSLARRSGVSPVIVLLTVVIGLLGFTLAAGDTLHRGWQQRAQVETGAARVLPATSTPVPLLVAGVRKADPEGRYAMAVAKLNAQEGLTILAVDSTRLAAVANWPQDQLSAVDVAKLLRPKDAAPLTITAEQIEFSVAVPAGTQPMRLQMRVQRVGQANLSLVTEQLPAGVSKHRLATPGCVKAICRLDEIEVKGLQGNSFQLDLTLGDITDGNGKVLAATGEREWIAPVDQAGQARLTFTKQPSGVAVSVLAGTSDSRFFPAALPQRVPVLATGPTPTELYGYGGALIYAVEVVAKVPLVPRFGDHGMMMDLEYSDLGPGSGADALDPEVWLTADAPADMVQRLRDNGVVLTGDRSAAVSLSHLENQAPALALKFLNLAAALAIGIGAAGLLVAAVLERGRPEDALSVLRPQGLHTRTLRAVAVGSRWAVLLVSVVAGIVAATASWLVGRDVIPAGAHGPGPVPAPVWPQWPMLTAGALAAIVVLMGVCWLAARLSLRGPDAQEGSIQ